ncbi:hypothetical protein LINGRAHAP2_LOCUS28236 [Linum grandiflorum]
MAATARYFCDGEYVRITIKTLKDNYFHLEMPLAQTTVMELKGAICEFLHGKYKPANQLLYFDGDLLEDDDSTLAANYISKDDFVFFMPKKPDKPTITIKKPDDSVTTITFDPTYKVRHLKKLIEDELGVANYPRSRQLLFLDRKHLENSYRLDQHNVCEDDVLQLIILDVPDM